MIIGNGTLTVAESVLITALQEYFNKRSAEGFAPKITGVKASSNNRGITYGTSEFDIAMSGDIKE